MRKVVQEETEELSGSEGYEEEEEVDEQFDEEIDNILGDTEEDFEEQSTETSDTDQEIMYVDDVANIRRIVKRTLEQEGYKVTAVKNVDEARGVLRKKELDLAILDVMMAGTGGVEFCREIRERKGEEELPIIMLTANRKKRTVMEALQAGANDYLVKPFESDLLINKVEEVMF